MDIKHDPHGRVSALGLVQLFHGVVSQEATSYHKEGVHSNEGIPHHSGRYVVISVP